MLLTKQLIDQGQIGNPSTGDILYDGGGKLNQVINALFASFGDQRLEAVGSGVGSQVLHATGYYQKHPRAYYASGAVDIGSMHDVDTTQGTLTISLPKGKVGEGVVIINSNGTVSPSQMLIVRPQVGETIEGANGNLEIKLPYSRVVVWCTKIVGGTAYWSYGVQSMFTDSTIPVEETVSVDTTKNIKICGKNDYSAVKLLITARTQDGTKSKTCETLLSIDTLNNVVISVEYAVVRNTDAEVFSMRYFIDQETVYAEVTATENTNTRFAIKAVDTITIGVAN